MSTQHPSELGDNLRKRPLSPHIQIYRWQWTMIYSILHRATGLVLTLAMIGAAIWVILLGFYPETYALVTLWFGTVLGRIALIGWTFALFYHLHNGIRHLIWDTGRMLSLKAAERSGHVVVVSAVAATGLLWALVFFAA